MVRYFDKLSIDRLTILSKPVLSIVERVEGQYRMSKIQIPKTPLLCHSREGGNPAF
jgi:hypothetical protein